MCFRLLNSTKNMKKSKNYLKRQKAIIRLVYEMMKLWSMSFNFHGYMCVRWPTLSEQNQKPHGKNKCPWQNQSHFAFAVKYLVLPCGFWSVLPWNILFLPWGFWFCRDSCGPHIYPGFMDSVNSLNIYFCFQFIWEGRGGEGGKIDFSLESALFLLPLPL